jgi:hypothetical protein
MNREFSCRYCLCRDHCAWIVSAGMIGAGIIIAEIISAGIITSQMIP